MFLIQGMYPAPKVDAVSLFGGYWMGGVVQVPVILSVLLIYGPHDLDSVIWL